MTLLILYVCTGIVCALIAAHKGRNAVGWFFVGLLTSLIGVIIVLVMSNLKEERARYQHALEERRRLREELKMERIKSKEFRGEARSRLDIHDRAIGVETTAGGTDSALPMTRGEIPPAAPGVAGGLGPPPPPPASAKKAPRWYYVTHLREQEGPMSLDELGDAYRAGGFTSSDLVWCEGWPEWLPAEEVPNLLEQLKG